jgi:hypothetical protein
MVKRIRKIFLCTLLPVLFLIQTISGSPASPTYAAVENIVLEVYDIRDVNDRIYVLKKLNDYYGGGIYGRFSFVNGVLHAEYSGGSVGSEKPFSDDLTIYEYPKSFIDNLSYWDCSFKEYNHAVLNYQVNSKHHGSKEFIESLDELDLAWAKLLGLLKKVNDYYGTEIVFTDTARNNETETSLVSTIANNARKRLANGSPAAFYDSEPYKALDEFASHIAKYDEGTYNVRYAAVNFAAFGRYGVEGFGRKKAEGDLVALESTYGESYLKKQKAVQEEMYAYDKNREPDFVMDSSKSSGIEKAGKGIFKIVMNAFGAIIYFIGCIVEWILNMLHVNLDAIIMGRINGNGIVIDTNAGNKYTSLFQFGLEDGNIYGTVAAGIYSVIRQYSYLIMSAVALFVYVKSLLSFSPQVNGLTDEGGAGKMSMAVLKNIILCFAAVAVMPTILGMVLDLRDMAVYYMTRDIRTHLFGSSDSVSVIDSVRPTDLGDDNLLGASVVWLIVQGSEATFLLTYVGYALHSVLLVIFFPFVCVKALIRGPRFFNEWANSFLGIIICPLIDSILFMVPSAFLSLSKIYSADGGANLTFTLLAALIIYMFKPMRSVVFDVLDLKRSSLGEAAEGAGKALAGGASAVVAAFAKSKTNKSAATAEGKEAASDNGKADAAEVAKKEEAAAETKEGEGEGENAPGLKKIEQPDGTTKAEFGARTGFYKAKAQLHEIHKNDEGIKERAQAENGFNTAVQMGKNIGHSIGSSVAERGGIGSIAKGAAGGLGRFGGAALRTGVSVGGALLGSGMGSERAARLGASLGYAAGNGMANFSEGAITGATKMVNNYRQDKKDFAEMVKTEEANGNPELHAEAMRDEVKLQGVGPVDKGDLHLANVETTDYISDKDLFENASNLYDTIDSSRKSPNEAAFVDEGVKNLKANAEWAQNFICDVGGAEGLVEKRSSRGAQYMAPQMKKLESKDFIRNGNAPETALKRIAEKYIDYCKQNPDKMTSDNEVMEQFKKQFSETNIVGETRKVIADNMRAADSPYNKMLDSSLNEAALAKDCPRKLSSDDRVNKFVNRQIVHHMADKFEKTQTYVDDLKILDHLMYASDEKDKNGQLKYNAKDDYTASYRTVGAVRDVLSSMKPEEIPDQLRFFWNR